MDAEIGSQFTMPPRVESRGVVLLERQWGFSRVALVSDAGTWKSRRYLLRLGRDKVVSAGDVVSFSGIASRFRRAEERSEFDEFRYWRAKGALWQVETTNISVVGRSFGPSLWRDRLSARIKKTLPPRTSGYMLASWVGERDPYITDLHRAAGTSHLLAVSGLHVGVVYAVCWFMLKRFRFRLYAISVILWLYVMLTGASPSSMRAAAMIQIIILGKLLGYPARPFNSVSAAGSLMLLCNPWLFWDVGWRLSMLAVLTLTAIYSSKIAPSVKYLLASPMVWLATSLQASWTFDLVPLVGAPINFLAVPLFGILLPGATLLSLPAVAGLKWGYYTAHIAELFFWMWEKFSSFLLALCPWRVNFGVSITIAGVAALTYFFALASGFSMKRAIFAGAINLACLSLFIFI
jgi:competence protein ComEC